MKIRIMGTQEELAAAERYYRGLEQEPNVKYVSVSRLYPNRGSNMLFRLYVDIEYKDLEVFETTQIECKGDNQ
ncbi:MAG: hypothetical protein SO434_04960 [Eubacteriales bacterium]|nr:hypothetical protein [Eubacteriales bacterium]